MAALDDLISQIPDESLRERIRAEVKRANRQKKFGLVFEEHLPEATPLYDTSAYGELIGRRVFHKSKKAYARVVGCDGEYMVLNFESGDKAGQDVKYNLTMCLNNGWIEVVD